MAKHVYDIQGTPIKLDSLVACLRDGCWADGLSKRRVHGFADNGQLYISGGWTAWPHQCVVLEEPVWPNS